MYNALVRRFGERRSGDPRLLVVGAHPDDAELEAGLASLIYAEMGYDVVHVALTSGEGRSGDRLEELEEAHRALGISQSLAFDYPDGRLGESAFKRAVLDDLERLRDEWEPHTVMFHSSKDRHQDHRAVHEYASIAFRDGPNKLEMEAPSTERALFEPRVYVRTESLSLALKAAGALRSFRSQRDIVDPFAALSGYVAAGRECVTKQQTQQRTGVEHIAAADPLGLDPRDYAAIGRLFPEGTVFAQRFEPNGIYIGR